jgi:hypothetical protein
MLRVQVSPDHTAFFTNSAHAIPALIVLFGIVLQLCYISCSAFGVVSEVMAFHAIVGNGSIFTSFPWHRTARRRHGDWHWLLLDVFSVALYVAGVVFFSLYVFEPGDLPSVQAGAKPEEFDTDIPRKLKVFKQILSEIERRCSNFTVYLLIQSTSWIVTMFRILHLQMFHPELGEFGRTVSEAARSLASLLIVLVELILGSGVVSMLYFGGSLGDFSTVNAASTTLFAWCMGDQATDELFQHFPAAGKVFYFGFMILVFFIAFNIILAVVIDSYNAQACRKPVIKNDRIRDQLKRVMFIWPLNAQLRELERWLAAYRLSRIQERTQRVSLFVLRSAIRLELGDGCDRLVTAVIRRAQIVQPFSVGADGAVQGTGTSSGATLSPTATAASLSTTPRAVNSPCCQNAFGTTVRGASSSGRKRGV